MSLSVGNRKVDAVSSTFRPINIVFTCQTRNISIIEFAWMKIQKQIERHFKLNLGRTSKAFIIKIKAVVELILSDDNYAVKCCRMFALQLQYRDEFQMQLLAYVNCSIAIAIMFFWLAVDSL
jgi:hypothetical protein